jgi:hypothetical protein
MHWAHELIHEDERVRRAFENDPMVRVFLDFAIARDWTPLEVLTQLLPAITERHAAMSGELRDVLERSLRPLVFKKEA